MIDLKSHSHGDDDGGEYWKSVLSDHILISSEIDDAFLCLIVLLKQCKFGTTF